jgi:nicotinamidase-related amidase
MKSRKIRRESAVLVVIDVQERLLPAIHESDALLKRLDVLARGCHTLGVPIVVTEQYVKGLGPTASPVKAMLDETYGYKPIEKMCFSSFGCGEFATQLEALGRKQVIVAGIEAHVCVYQTALDLLDGGYDVYVVTDAVSSRRTSDREAALARLAAEGAKVVSSEMVLFEMTVTSGTEEFKAISRLVK